MSAAPPINSLSLDPRTYARGRSCVHCGLCLPACPTYMTTGNEADSPRGRIQLMLALSDGTIGPTDSVKEHLNLCLDCRGCETACPSGVVYHELIEETRAKLDHQAKPGLTERFMQWTFFHILTKPFRLKLALLPGRIFKKLGLFNLLPASLRKMGQMLPDNLPLWPQSPTGSFKAPNAKCAVELFPTCIGSVVYTDVNRKAIALLNASGTDVKISPSQACCGAIHLHNGDDHTAAELARRNIDVMSSGESKYIVTTIAGCGAMFREYGHLLRDDPQYAERAKQFSEKVRDISEVLLELGLPKMPHPVNQSVTYHDACHLAHAQKVAAAPRKLLSQISGLKLVPLLESDMCCGAAGTYNLTQPEMATQLAKRKLENIGSTGCQTCVASNVGCAMHIQSQAQSTGRNLTVVHPVELLHRAVFGSDEPQV